MASTAVALSARAETTRISTLELIATNSCTHSTPSISGMVRSMVTTSGCVRRNNSTASRPLLAAPTTSRRAICWERSMRRRMMFESSTIMSFNVGLGWPSIGSRRLGVVRALDGARQRHGQAGKFSVAGRNRDPPAELIGEVGDDVHAHTPSRILGRVLNGREPRLKQQREDLLRIQGERPLRSDEPLLERGLLDALGRQALAIVFDDELVAGIAGVLERQAHGALRGLPGGQAHLGRFDAVYDGIAHRLDADVLDRAPIFVGHRVETPALQRRLLVVFAGDPLGQLLQRRRHPRIRFAALLLLLLFLFLDDRGDRMSRLRLCGLKMQMRKARNQVADG